MIWAALRLHEATGEQRYFEQARAWTEMLDRHYWVDGRGRICNLCRRHARRDRAPAPRQPTTRRPTPTRIMLANLVALGDADRRGALHRPRAARSWPRSPASSGVTLSHTRGCWRHHSTSSRRSKWSLPGSNLDGGKTLSRSSEVFLCPERCSTLWMTRRRCRVAGASAIRTLLTDEQQLTYVLGRSARRL